MSSLTKREGAGSPHAVPRFDPEPGALVGGKYRIERTIGEGGMGIVVAATHVELEQRVAIKFLSPDAMGSDEAVERFLREAKVAAKVKNEHVARVSDVGKMAPSDTPFIVMELLEGKDLGALIDGGAALPLEEACEIALQAAEALAEVHTAGIVHRDLKPSNLFITRRADGAPFVKLLDFGISKFGVQAEGSGGDPALTATATIMGSPSYMSPEQLKSTREVDARTDVWSLGAVLYEAVTGKRAFKAETVVQVCAFIASEQPAAPSSVRPEVPAELERIILACLEKDAERRATLVDLARVLVRFAPPRAQASLERIEAVLGVLPSRPVSRADRSLPALPLATTEPARTQASWDRPKRRKRGGLGSLLFLVILAGGALGAGVYLGLIDVDALRGRIASATGTAASAAVALGQAVAPASAGATATATSTSLASPASAASSQASLMSRVEEASAPAASATASATASTGPLLPVGDAAADADDDDDDDDDDEAADAMAAPQAVAAVPTAVATAATSPPHAATVPRAAPTAAATHKPATHKRHTGKHRKRHPQ